MFSKLISLVAAAAILSGCGAVQETLTRKYGPRPVPAAAAVEDAAIREMAIVETIARAAGYLQPVGREQWYEVILVGFNVVDDACMSYIEDLWILERRKARNSTLITATGAAVSAIISASSNPSASTLEILTQAFGLAAALNNAFAESYLYTQNAATIKKLIQITTNAYRNALAASVYRKTEVDFPMGSPAAAYHHMREYLALCLAPTIQAQIEDLVAKAKAAPAESTAAAAAARDAGVPRPVRSVPRSTSPNITVF